MTSAPRNLLRILVVGPDPARYVGGIASFVRFQMTSSALSREFKLLNLDTGAAVGKRRPALYRLLRACFRLARLILALVRYRPSLAHIHASSSGSFFEKAAMALFCRVAAVRTILHIHSGNFEAFYKGSRCRWFIRFCLDRAGAIVTVSPRWSAFFSAVTSSRIETVPNCPAEEFFDAGSSPGKNRNMVFSGLLCGYKGVPELFEAVRLLRERGLDNPLVLLGESGEDLELESHRAQAQAMGLRNVSFRGEVSSGEVAGALADAAVFVLPSHEEGLPIAMLEAMAAGLPVVVTPVGGSRTRSRTGSTVTLSRRETAGPSPVASSCCCATLICGKRWARPTARKPGCAIILKRAPGSWPGFTIHLPTKILRSPASNPHPH